MCVTLVGWCITALERVKFTLYTDNCQPFHNGDICLYIDLRIS